MRKILLIMTIGLLALSFVTANELVVDTKIVAEFQAAEVGVEVPSEIHLPLVANGYVTTESFEVKNIGNTPIQASFQITDNLTEMSSNYHPVFNLLEFQRNSFGDYLPIIEDAYLKIQRPIDLGGYLTTNNKLRLDLTTQSFDYNATEEVYLVTTVIPLLAE